MPPCRRQTALGAVVSILLLTAAPSIIAEDVIASRARGLLERTIREDGPGAVFLVGKGDTIICTGARGRAHIELGVSLQASHVFRIASITKMFVASSVLKPGRKRCALARRAVAPLAGDPGGRPDNAILKDAPILILEEATSSLDSESEALIQDALWTLMAGRTAIVIAHRLSTVRRMDSLVVLDRGRIVEQGSHEHLLALGGIYASLWSHQSGGFLPATDVESVAV
jgi:hypothetical protein